MPDEVRMMGTTCAATIFLQPPLASLQMATPLDDRVSHMCLGFDYRTQVAWAMALELNAHTPSMEAIDLFSDHVVAISRDARAEALRCAVLAPSMESSHRIHHHFAKCAADTETLVAAGSELAFNFRSDQTKTTPGLVQQQSSEAPESQAPEKFVRRTTKFWIRADRLLEVQAAIARHIPIHLFSSGKDQGHVILPLPGSPAATAARLPRGSATSDSISSVYLEALGGKVYSRRWQREDGASLTRLRCYGNPVAFRAPGAAPLTMFVETKIHREGWTGENSSKDRAKASADEIATIIRKLRLYIYVG